MREWNLTALRVALTFLQFLHPIFFSVPYLNKQQILLVPSGFIFIIVFPIFVIFFLIHVFWGVGNCQRYNQDYTSVPFFQKPHQDLGKEKGLGLAVLWIPWIILDGLSVRDGAPYTEDQILENADPLSCDELK